ncbi:TnsA endonuclease N-terminal domain-containing protein [Pseudophaeobacter sp.]|uniref:TnsA endonuclease N-terminal domain-containing protein n=1 Tax=Pseudophaeobacter sp. TaxID=1971739 RepID=UPI002629F8A5|nr:TnsA endonuclease N-terminal domain-containing protein [Pseudophaeobacter sp.]
MIFLTAVLMLHRYQAVQPVGLQSVRNRVLGVVWLSSYRLWDRPRVVHFESKLEQRVLFMLLAGNDVVDLWEQPRFVTYRDLSGQRKYHFFDFLVQFEDGQRVAIAVKPEKEVKRMRFMSELRYIREAISKDFADQVRLITNSDFTKAEALNAERYHDFRRHKDARWMPALETALESAALPMTVKQLADSLDLERDGFRAVVVGIYEGLLEADRTAPINAETLVMMGDRP